MKAKYAIILEKEIIQILEEDINENKLHPNQLLVQSETSIVSAGTELAAFTALSKGVYKKGSFNAYPWRPGYGLVGRVVKKGEAVLDFNPGDRIFCFGTHSSLQTYDLDSSGQMPFKSAFHLDEKIDKVKAVVARMGLVAITALQISDYEVGDTVVVFGLGIIGNIASQIFQLGGANVITLDPVKGRCKVAEVSGLKTVLNLGGGDQVAAIKDLTHGKGADISLDAVGDSRVIGNCLRSTKRNGEVILLGSPRADYEMNITEEYNLIHMQSLTVKGALEWRLPPYPSRLTDRTIASNLDFLINLISSGKLQVDRLISHVIKPEELPDAYRGLLDDKEKYHGVVINWQ